MARVARLLGGTVSASTLLLALVAPALAQEVTTTGAVSPTPPTPPASSWAVPVDLRVGNAGTGTVVVSGGGQLTVGQTSFVGNDAGENGTITVTGDGSLWQTQGAIQIGRNGGTGKIVVTDGARLETYDGSLYMGEGGRLEITGAGTVVDFGTKTPHFPADWVSAAGYLSVDEGSVLLSGGALLHDDAGYLGNLGDTYAEMLVTGQGTQWTNDISLYVGGTGNNTIGRGRLTIADGAIATAYTSALGVDAGSYGELLVTGAGSKLSVSLRDGFSGKFRAGYDGNAKAVVQAGGMIESASAIEIASNAGSSGVIAIGAATDMPAEAAGYLEAPNGVVFGLGDATLAFNHTETNYLFDLKLSGTGGKIQHLAGKTTYAGDGSGFTGTTTVLGGQLYVNGTLGGVTTVGSGGTLGGTGTLDDLSIGTGGVVRPGNSIGTLNVAGDYLQASGATYIVELDPRSSASDKIDVRGSATLTPGALLSWERGAPGAFIPGSVYTILSSDGALSGTFTWSGSSDVSAFYGLADSYDAHNAYLTVAQHTSLEDAALTENQETLAALLEALPESNAVRGAAAMTEDFAAARDAFDDFSGDVHAGLTSLLIGRMAAGSGVVQKRLAGHDEGLWGIVSTDSGLLTSDGNGGGVGMGGVDGVAGVDGQVGAWRAGVLARGNVSGLGSPDRSFGGVIATGGVGAYAGTSWDETSIDLTADVGVFGVHSERDLAISALNETLEANYGGSYSALSARIAHEVDLGDMQLVPYAQASYVVVRTDDISESGGAAALDIEGFTNDALIGRLGVDLNRDFVMADGSVVATRLGLGVQASSMDAPAITAGFNAGSDFVVHGTALPEAAIVVEAGIERALGDGLTLGLDYSGTFGESAQMHGVKLGVTGNF